MTKSINIKINEELLDSLRNYDEVNWSGVVRSALINKLEELDTKKFDLTLAKKAFQKCRKIHDEGIFNGKDKGVEIIRVWRDKKR